MNKTSAIGTRKESSLHRSLKFRYSGGGQTEVLIGDYVCDAKTSKGEIIEVQTGSLGPLKKKAKFLTQTGKLNIIHPIINQKQIELYDVSGQLLHRRKSPKKGNVWDLFNALIHAPELPLHKNLNIELALIDVVEKRIDDGAGSWRRKGVSINDRFLGAWHNSIILKDKRDYYQFIPFEENECFTARNLAEKVGIATTLAQKTLYVLKKMGLIERIGKLGNAYEYMKNPLRKIKAGVCHE